METERKQPIYEESIVSLMFHVFGPIFVNPCSYYSWWHVLRDINQTIGIEMWPTGTENGSPHIALTNCAITAQLSSLLVRIMYVSCVVGMYRCI